MNSIYLNDPSKGKVIYPDHYEVDDEDYKVPLDIITDYHFTTTSKATDQMESNLLYLPLRRHFKSWFLHMNFPRLSEENSNGTMKGKFSSDP